MRNDRIIPGAIFIIIGAMILLHNYDYLHIHWANFIYLWPIFIVIGGINLIFAHNRSGWATALKLLVVIAGFALLIFGDFDAHNHWGRWFNRHHYTYSDDNDDDDDDNSGDVVKVQGSSQFNTPFTNDIKVAQLNISGGATEYKLTDTTNQLFNADTKEFYGKYEFTHEKQDSMYVLNFNMKENHMAWHNHDKSNEAVLKLNSNPEWLVNVEGGATGLNFDLSKFKVKSLSLKGGAASFDVKLGQPLAVTNVDVEAGASSVNINIPQSAACRITTETGLASNDFEGFTKKDNGDYETPGFSAAKNKMYVHIQGGVSDFRVKRY